ncbi:hypothetical protein IAE22_31430, partial [Bacillus sp. S34]|nr:hypothetical protein [Bacillus sp. S34]
LGTVTRPVTGLVDDTLGGVGTIYESLFFITNVNNNDPKPLLGKSYEWNGDGTQLTITLRDGATWSDGQPFTSKDGVDTAAGDLAVELMTSPSGTTGLVQDLVAGRLDIAYTGLPGIPTGVVVEPLREMPFRVFLSADHPLADRGSV